MKITLCGSTKFKQAFMDWNAILTQNGHLVYSVGFFMHTDGDALQIDEWQKVQLDLVHLLKIQESDAIMVINPLLPGDDDSRWGYIGESTRREIEWARLLGREVYALRVDGPECSQAETWRDLRSAFGRNLDHPFIERY